MALRVRPAILAGIILALGGAGLALRYGITRFRDSEPAREASGFLRGESAAARLGCFGCHGPGGMKGAPDRSAPTGSVPSWSGGTAMMYLQNEGEIREYVLDGGPARILSSPPRTTIRMPAFRGRVTERELDDLVTYFKAVAAYEAPADPEAAKGRGLAFELGCFGCHGPEGRALTPNPGSFKGYIPPWDGDDFGDLVDSDAEIDEWILNGESARFRNNPIAARFLDRQTIKMPAFRERLQAGELESLRAFIRWVRLTRK